MVSFLSQRATSFAHDGVSHIVVLDGEVGVGKSHVLRHLSHVFRPIVNATTAEPHLNAATAAAAAKLQFVWGVGDPFLTSKPHSVWRQVFDTILPVMNPATRHHTHMHSSRKPAKDDESGDGEEEKKDGLRGSGGAGHINVFVGRAERQGSHAVHTNPSHVDSQSTRRDWILKFAASKNFPPQPRVFAFFNDMLGTNFEETAEEKTRRSQHYNHGGAAAALAATQAAAAAAAAAAGAMTPSELRAAAGELLVLLLQEYAASQKVIVALDECQSMSEPDWNATFEVCKAIKAARIK